MTLGERIFFLGAIALTVIVFVLINAGKIFAHNVKNPEKAVAHADGVILFFGQHRQLARTSVGRRSLVAHRWLRRVRLHQLPVYPAIRYVFGAYAGQAWRVAGCESTWSIYAHNGQYRGLFQMGSNERATYGHDWTPYGQAAAAYRYFAASGYDWSPWECKP